MKKLMLALAFLGAAMTAQAQETIGPFQEGVHFHKIEGPNVTPVDGVRVTEVFSYLCNHCATFEPYMQAWKGRKADDVELTRIPVEFGRAIWSLSARAYVTASMLGVAEESHVPMMDALWKDRRQMRSMEELADFYAEFGVDPAKFVATSKSFAVDMRVKNEQKMVRDAGVSGTPAMLVNDRYRVSAGGAVNDFDTMLAIVDALVEHEKAQMNVASVADGATEVASQ